MCGVFTASCRLSLVAVCGGHSLLAVLVFSLWVVCVLVAQLYLTLCDLLDCSPPGSSIHGVLQARIQKWVAILFSRESSRPRDQTQVSRIAGRFFTI